MLMMTLRVQGSGSCIVGRAVASIRYNITRFYCSHPQFYKTFFYRMEKTEKEGGKEKPISSWKMKSSVYIIIKDSCGKVIGCFMI